jgi:hypothetical protein
MRIDQTGEADHLLLTFLQIGKKKSLEKGSFEMETVGLGCNFEKLDFGLRNREILSSCLPDFTQIENFVKEIGLTVSQSLKVNRYKFKSELFIVEK